MRKTNPDRDRERYQEKLPQMPGPRDGGSGRRRESREHGPTGMPLPHMMKKVMQAFPAYPNSALIAGGPSVGISNSGRTSHGTPNFGFSDGAPNVTSLSPLHGRTGSGRHDVLFLGASAAAIRSSSNEDRQYWTAQTQRIATAGPILEDSSQTRSSSPRTNWDRVSSSLPLPPVMLSEFEESHSGHREKIRLKRSERNERSGRSKTSRDSDDLEEILTPPTTSGIQHFVVDKPAARKISSNITTKSIIRRGGPYVEPRIITKSERRPQTTAVLGNRISSHEHLHLDHSEIIPASVEKLNVAVARPERKVSGSGSGSATKENTEELFNHHETSAGSSTASMSAAAKGNPSNSQLKVRVRGHSNSRSRTRTKPVRHSSNFEEIRPTVAHEDKFETHTHSNCTCIKCNVLTRKLKSQSQTTKNLQRQNGCLESIITQKRNLVEQLTRQVRGLIKENFQLAKGAGLESGQESGISTDSLSGTTMPEGKLENADLAGSSSASSSLQRKSEERPGISDNKKSNELNTVNRTRSKVTLLAVPAAKRHSISSSRSVGVNLNRRFTAGKNPDLLEQYDKQVEALQNENEFLQKRVDKFQKEHMNTSRFLTDLLYTLNARGYESVTDYDGSVVDLCRCRGDHLLDLKGRDARVRTPVKRMNPQETLLKAVIGSQEKLIQNLFIQLDTRTKEVLLGSRLTSCTGSVTGGGADTGTRNAALEGEILALVCLIEGACQRNPDIFHVLQDQALIDRETKHSSGMSANNVVIEAVLDRCQRMLCTGAPPTSPRLRSRGRESSGSLRSGTPPPYQTRLLNGSGSHSHSHSHSGRSSSGYSGSRQSSPEEHRQYQVSQPLPLLETDYPSIAQEFDKYQAHHPTTRSNLRSATVTGNWNLSRQKSQPRLHSATSSSSRSPQRTGGRETNKLMPRCRFCGMKFPPNSSLAEINSHIELHNL